MNPARPKSIELIAGHVALDLVNTVSWRRDSSRWRENLSQPADLLTWCRRAHLLDHALDTPPPVTAEAGTPERTLQEVRDLREHLHDHLIARIADPTAAHEIARAAPLNRAFTDAVGASDLAGTPPRWQLAVHVPSDIPRLLALYALDLLQAAPLQRLRRCHDDSCGWLFLDTTRNQSRRWCSSGDCGNRDRARRHYARTHKPISRS